MTIKAIGPSGLLLAAGLFVCLAGPSPATAAGAEDAAAATKPETAGKPVALHKYARQGSRHGKKYAHRGSGNVAQKATTGDKTADAADDGDHSSPMPASVANANAQLTPAQPTSADSPTGNAARAMTARASNILQATPDKPADAPPPADAQSDAQVVSANQLNDVDRALRETPPTASTPPAAPLAVAPTEAPVAARSNESSAWDQTSLIGKIFIGFGAVLTMASAARMFMA
jgi:hypothetical protein